MKKLNSHHLSALLNISKNEALQKIWSVKKDFNVPNYPSANMPNEQDYEAAVKRYKAAMKPLYSGEYITQEQLKTLGYDYDIIVKDIQANYHKTPSCVNWVMEQVDKAINKKNKATGAYPKSVNIPKEVLYFISMEQREFFRHKIEEKYAKLIEEHQINVLV